MSKALGLSRVSKAGGSLNNGFSRGLCGGLEFGSLELFWVVLLSRRSAGIETNRSIQGSSLGPYLQGDFQKGAVFQKHHNSSVS